MKPPARFQVPRYSWCLRLRVIWLWVKNRHPKWNPVKWNQGLKNLRSNSWWFNFDPRPQLVDYPRRQTWATLDLTKGTLWWVPGRTRRAVGGVPSWMPISLSPVGKPHFWASLACQSSSMRCLHPSQGSSKKGSRLKQSTQSTQGDGQIDTHESQSKPGTKMVDPEPCKELRRRPQLFIAGIVPYWPSLFPGFNCGSNGTRLKDVRN